MLEALLGATGGAVDKVFFTIIPNATSLNQGSVVEFEIFPSGHIKGHEYYWTLGGTYPDELIEGPTEGGVTFATDDPQTIQIKTVSDEFRDENFTLVLTMHPRKGSSTELVKSSEITVVYSAHPTGSYIQVATESREWVVPDDVTEIAVVCVGGGQGSEGEFYGRGGMGGALRWRNDIPVVPGETLTLEVGKGGSNSSDLAQRQGGSTSIKRGESVILRAAGGGGTDSSRLSETVGGGDGGRGALGGYDHGPGGGGGAGGYTGEGGVGGNRLVASHPGEGGAGGGGSYYNTESNDSHHATPGGGVGLYGQGANGAAGVRGDALKGGGGGSNGDTGTWIKTGIYGGGARGQSSNNGFGAVTGGNGGLRIIWGPGRAFPNTRTEEL